MSIATNDLAADTWMRYQYLRDNGHLDYVHKALRCEDFFAGMQWEKNDLALLRQQRRPALTINKIIATLSNVMGEQIFNRTEIAFRPRNEGANDELAATLTKVFMQISDNNQLPWVRSDVFADGIIGSRGFIDVRLDFSDNLRGEVRLEQLNPKNVLIDIDADSYDPDKWGDVITSRWMSPDQIAMLYSKKLAEELRGRVESYFPYGFDSIDLMRDRFGSPYVSSFGYGPEAERGITRNIRVIERQWRKLDNVKHFVDIVNGDMRPIPYEWDDERIAQYLAQNPGHTVIKKLIHRIRWTVVADAVVLHDDWSPYKHFTVVPFFPYFRRGRTIGLVENLLGPQELLNKVSSQELHVVNTTANSGWKIKRNALQNMSTAELEQRGATTGLVLELDDINNAEKIAPNQTPSGLDRISFKSEEHIKSISGVSDYQTGNAREDVSAKAVKLNQSRGSANFAKVMDNLNRTDHILARNILDLVQEFYSEPRVLMITTDQITGTTEPLSVNQPGPDGKIQNDLTIGEYAVVISNQPERDTFEDSQFEQALQLRTEAGVNIPDEFIISASKLKDKAKIVQAINSANTSPEAQEMQQIKLQMSRVQLQKEQAEASQKSNDAQLKSAKTKKELIAAQKEAMTPPEGGNNGQEAAQHAAELSFEERKFQMEHDLAVQRMQKEFELKKYQIDQELAMKREAAEKEAELKRQQMHHDAVNKRVAEVTKAQTARKQDQTGE